MVCGTLAGAFGAALFFPCAQAGLGAASVSAIPQMRAARMELENLALLERLTNG